jgi:hypothetical protein
MKMSFFPLLLLSPSLRWSPSAVAPPLPAPSRGVPPGPGHQAPLSLSPTLTASHRSCVGARVLPCWPRPSAPCAWACSQSMPKQSTAGEGCAGGGGGPRAGSGSAWGCRSRRVPMAGRLLLVCSCSLFPVVGSDEVERRWGARTQTICA